MVLIVNKKKPKDCEHCWNHFDCVRYASEAVSGPGVILDGCPIVDTEELINKIKELPKVFASNKEGIPDIYCSETGLLRLLKSMEVDS